jgi:hypothetical protein
LRAAVVLAALAAAVMTVMAQDDLAVGDLSSNLGTTAAASAYATLGALVVRRAGNTVGWIMLGGASTLVVAALFSPVRQRVQRRVDGRFNRARYDADQTVAGFAAQLKDSVDLDTVRDDLTVVVQTALEPTHISVWVRH